MLYVADHEKLESFCSKLGINYKDKDSETIVEEIFTMRTELTKKENNNELLSRLKNINLKDLGLIAFYT